MSEQAPHRRAHRHIVPGPLSLDDDHHAGEEVLHFMRWILRSKYRLMGEFLGDLQTEPERRDPAALRSQFCRTLQHAERVHRGRGIVTFLLALGVVATAATTVANALGVDSGLGVLARAAAYSGSATVLLVGLRLLFDRYLERVDVVATFLAAQMAGARAPANA